MKILNDVTSKKKAIEAAADDAEAAEVDEEGLALDSIGCTANVCMIDYS
jgi:hypothetical protein